MGRGEGLNSTRKLGKTIRESLKLLITSLPGWPCCKLCKLVRVTAPTVRTNFTESDVSALAMSRNLPCHLGWVGSWVGTYACMLYACMDVRICFEHSKQLLYYFNMCACQVCWKLGLKIISFLLGAALIRCQRCQRTFCCLGLGSATARINWRIPMSFATKLFSCHSHVVFPWIFQTHTKPHSHLHDRLKVHETFLVAQLGCLPSFAFHSALKL